MIGLAAAIVLNVMIVGAVRPVEVETACHTSGPLKRRYKEWGLTTTGCDGEAHVDWRC